MASTRCAPAPVLLIALSSLAACGPEFTGVASGAGGVGVDGIGKANMGGGAEAGESSAGTASRGGAGTGGDPAAGGKLPSIGTAGSGDEPVVSAPVIPQEGLELWLRADAGVSEVDGIVSSWKDGSRHGRDALQVEARSRPKLVPGALSGQAALVFDGDDDYLALPPLDADLSHGASMFIAFQQDAIGACGAWFEASNGRELQELHFGDWKSSVIYEIAESWLSDTQYPLLMGEPQVTGAVHGADDMVKLRTNGASVGQGAVKLSPPDVSRKFVYVGKTLYSDCDYFKGSIGEILLYGRAVTSQEMLEIEGYLQSKWGCCQ